MDMGSKISSFRLGKGMHTIPESAKRMLTFNNNKSQTFSRQLS